MLRNILHYTRQTPTVKDYLTPNYTINEVEKSCPRREGEMGRGRGRERETERETPKCILFFLSRFLGQSSHFLFLIAMV